MSIHDELERIAAHAPDIALPPDTWARAQRARRRERVTLVALVVAALAVAGSLVWLPARDGVDPAGGRALGVPDRLATVPERMSDRENDGSWMREEVTRDAALGTGAAAWVTPQGLPVLVDAVAGRYHLLDLPDFAGNNWSFAIGLGDPVVALSPDGTRLAYGYAVFGPDAATEPIPSGVRVVDLGTGEVVREVSVPGHEGTAISRIAWSPDGSWLALAGMQQSYWTAEAMGVSEYVDDAGAVLGRVAPGAVRAELRPIRDDEGALAIDDRGSVRFGYGELLRWDGSRTLRRGSAERTAITLGLLADGSRVRLDDVAAWSAGAVVLAPPSGRPRRVIDIEPGIGATLSVATDLMSAERPTVDRPEPDWPLSEEQWAARIGGAALAMLVLVAGGFHLRRRWRRRG